MVWCQTSYTEEMKSHVKLKYASVCIEPKNLCNYIGSFKILSNKVIMKNIDINSIYLKRFKTHFKNFQFILVLFICFC